MIGNHFWNATRVRNFVIALGKKPTKWDENLILLAKNGAMTVDTLLETDPISYGVKIWGYEGLTKNPSAKIRKILGVLNYESLMHFYGKTIMMAPGRPLLEEIDAVELLQQEVADARDAYDVAVENYDEAYKEAKSGYATWDDVNAAHVHMGETASVFVELENKLTDLESAAKPMADALAATPKPVEPVKPLEPVEQEKTKWECPTCSAVWRTKARHTT